LRVFEATAGRRQDSFFLSREFLIIILLFLLLQLGNSRIFAAKDIGRAGFSGNLKGKIKNVGFYFDIYGSFGDDGGIGESG
jgi:hypothetical protein